MTNLIYEDFCRRVREAASLDKLLPTFRKQHFPSKSREAFTQRRRRPEYPVASMRKTPDSQLMHRNPNQQRRDNATK